ncbi:beta-ketoacyl-[acyl-carrier-protein] synthase family protein [Leucobacter sp. USHLN153]|uniref:beta-ketoacyl-[acyl-carrier-protein] synthase family protein n=1 Tax=Leucobacter sp. USHLN153 TaxID=3081268 RepID=UPI003015A572
MKRKVVVTGLGAVTPSGIGVDAMWDSVVRGRSAIRVLEGSQFDELPVRIGGQISGFETEGLVSPGLARRLSPVQLWALAAADEALAHAGLQPSPEAWAGDEDRVTIIAATGSGPVDAMQAATRALDERGPRAVPLSLAVYGAPDAAAALLAQRYGATGPAQGVSATCASGAVALGEALRRIRHGYADAALVVGMEDCLGAVNLASNANLRSLAVGYESHPAEASRPFDRARAGFVMSQGASAILLESEERARARGAVPLAELAGFGASSDAYHATAPDPEARGASRAIELSLADAELAPSAIDHVNLHGTGTLAGDAAEIVALRRTLGERAESVPLTATKSSTGHLLGAAGVVEGVIAVLSLAKGRIPPTMNLADPEFPELDFVSGTAREVGLGTVLSTSFGFGGHNGALVFQASADGRHKLPGSKEEDR